MTNETCEGTRRISLLIAVVATAGALVGCSNQIWNASDLVVWVKDRAVEKGCERQSIELKEWYDSDKSGNTWHGSCVSTQTGKRMTFGIDVDPVWKPSSGR